MEALSRWRRHRASSHQAIVPSLLAVVATPHRHDLPSLHAAHGRPTPVAETPCGLGPRSAGSGLQGSGSASREVPPHRICRRRATPRRTLLPLLLATHQAAVVLSPRPSPGYRNVAASRLAGSPPRLMSGSPLAPPGHLRTPRRAAFTSRVRPPPLRGPSRRQCALTHRAFAPPHTRAVATGLPPRMRATAASPTPMGSRPHAASSLCAAADAIPPARPTSTAAARSSPSRVRQPARERHARPRSCPPPFHLEHA